MDDFLNAYIILYCDTFSLEIEEHDQKKRKKANKGNDEFIHNEKYKGISNVRYDEVIVCPGNNNRMMVMAQG